MAKKIIYISEFDFDRLYGIIESASANIRDKEYLKQLTEELEQAEVVSPEEIPKDVITMNSQFRLRDMDSKQETDYTLVFPHQANLENNKVSILAPIGVALIGCKVGHTVSWKTPNGQKKFKIIKILYQPEAAGDFHL
jgi:regulator of nucleoside diphosphate kinase